jgi:L-2-hydroxyglutarate oxidase
MSLRQFDVAVIGGGIVGLATARALLRAAPGLSLVVLEAEARLAAHQTGHNSGVIHSGLYYKPGSLKAQTCTEGREELYRFCAEHAVPHERCGKVVVATRAEELPALRELERRGRANGLTGLRVLGPEGVAEHEPHVRGVAGLFVVETGIVDYSRVSAALAEVVRSAGGEVRLGARLIGHHRRPDGQVLRTAAGEVYCRNLITCAGLQSDRVARLCGCKPGLQIIPFRGEYYELVPERRHLVRNLVYPVPDARFPFLGVHFTRMIEGGIEAGPNAVLALRREGYQASDVSARDLFQMAGYSGFWRMACRYGLTGMGELWRSLSKYAFWKALRRLLPELRMSDLRPAGSGVRAQAVAPDGSLLDDFRIVTAERAIHVLNAPSPAATASLSIGRAIAARAVEVFQLPAGES